MRPLPDRDAWAEYSHLLAVGVRPEVAALLAVGLAGGHLRVHLAPHVHPRRYWATALAGVVTCAPCRIARRRHTTRTPSRSSA